jgi:hypothetical protein
MLTKNTVTKTLAATLAALALSVCSAQVAEAATTCNRPGAQAQCQGDGHGFENPSGKQPSGQNK